MFDIISCYGERQTLNIKSNVLDIDECNNNTHKCDGNATCTNTMGDYNCTCYDGFSGDGFNCQGKTK
jgi:hypothetical protein